MTDDEQRIIEAIKTGDMTGPKDIAIELDMDIGAAHAIVVGMLRSGSITRNERGLLEVIEAPTLPTCERCGKALSSAQVRASMQSVFKVLCDEHRVAVQQQTCPRCGAIGGHYLGCITYDAMMHREVAAAYLGSEYPTTRCIHHMPMTHCPDCGGEQ